MRRSAADDAEAEAAEARAEMVEAGADGGAGSPTTKRTAVAAAAGAARAGDVAFCLALCAAYLGRWAEASLELDAAEASYRRSAEAVGRPAGVARPLALVAAVRRVVARRPTSATGLPRTPDPGDGGIGSLGLDLGVDLEAPEAAEAARASAVADIEADADAGGGDDDVVDDDDEDDDDDDDGDDDDDDDESD